MVGGLPKLGVAQNRSTKVAGAIPKAILPIKSLVVEIPEYRGMGSHVSHLR